ncbi:Uncharacterized protein SCF082_LOCUS42356 [Durusdinium trenchii]|uniref:YbaK/aminoacyl-tRNA synthetase-associated domain-containing protein n=1 Tax=Durusdinium trenchii TaxID=1381693 RepID=A0ABP0QRQ2_9DINO
MKQSRVSTWTAVGVETFGVDGPDERCWYVPWTSLKRLGLRSFDLPALDRARNSSLVSEASFGWTIQSGGRRPSGESGAGLKLSAVLLAVESEPPYYEQSLEWRRDRLGAGAVEELCKSVVLENTKLDDASEPGRVRCVLVIVQYVAKLHKEKLIKVVQALEAARSLAPLGKKQYNMRLLEGAACEAITGCGHNAVTPLGQDLPMILSDGIAKLEHFWLGGGHVDLKLRLNTAEAIKTFEMTVADVTS